MVVTLSIEDDEAGRRLEVTLEDEQTYNPTVMADLVTRAHDALTRVAAVSMAMTDEEQGE